MDDPKRVKLLLLPGFALLPTDYKDLMSILQCHIHTIDIWPQTVEEIQRIGEPGTETFGEWFKDILNKCQLVCDRENINVVFAHSAGNLFAEQLENVKVIGFGCKKSENAYNIRGLFDTVVSGETDKLVGCGHMGCVSKRATLRFYKLQEKLGNANPPERFIDGHAVIGKHINNLLQDIHNQKVSPPQKSF